MQGYSRCTVIVLFGCVVVLTSFVAVHSQSGAQSVLEDAALLAVKEWPLSNGDWGNTRYSTLSQINTRNTKDLRAVWISQRFEDGALSRSTPVVKDGLMFVTAGTRVYAINAKTGQSVWSFQTDARKPVAGLETTRGQAEVLISGQGLPNSQGVAAGEGKVFVGITDGRVIALSQKTGELLWNRQTGEDPPHRGQSVSSAPVYAGGGVFTGLANGDFGLRGRVVALDAKTGHELWHFFTVPGPGEVGHDTWPQDSDIWKQGGAGVWLPGTVDPDLGMVYFVTGNGVPQTGGELRAGDNLFTSSVVALDMKTGKLRWHYQVIHHDIWDADIATPPVLYIAQVDGRPRKALATMRPDGYLFLLDRETGKPLIPVEERPVPQDRLAKTAATQPFPVGADSILPDCSEWKDKVPPAFVLGCTYTPFSFDNVNVLAPGFTVRVSPMSYSPQTGYFYTQGSATLGSRRRLSEDPWFFTVGGAGGGIALLNLPSRSFFGALDSRTGKIVWKKEVPPGTLGRSGAITTAGGLMFRGGGDGNFEAYDAKTGVLLWQFQIGSEATPASTYEIDGEQYIAMAAGSNVWAFKLGGTIQPLEARQRSAAGSTAGGGLVFDTNHIETASLVRDIGVNGGQRYAVDEHTFNPTRARVRVGTWVTWMNNGRIVHTIVAQDGSWTTGTLQPAEESSVTFKTPGTYTYICKQHPWAIGQLIVLAESAQDRVPTENQARQRDTTVTRNAQASFYTAEQARRGRSQYTQTCSSCHGDDLSGSGQAPPLVGQTFLLHWEGRNIADLLGKITTMPPNSPGSLSPETYLDIAAFLLQTNDFPAGQEELKNNAEALKRTILK